jgi:hypothetical protein
MVPPVFAAVAAFGALAAPAYAHDDQWANNTPMPANNARYNSFMALNAYLTGAYCNVHEANRNIYIAAVDANQNQYGTFVNYGSGGWRTYSGSNLLVGACQNNHSVSIHYDAIDRYPGS